MRGNHEDRVLLAYRDLQYHHRLSQHAEHTDHHAEGSTIPSPPNPGNPNAAKEAEPDAEADQDIDGENFTSGDHVNQQLARSLSLKQISYLASCPLILDIGPVRGMGEVRAVHAGLVPGVSLDRQDPISVMHMRTLDLKTHIPSRSGSGTPWIKVRLALSIKFSTRHSFRPTVSLSIMTFINFCCRYGTNIRACSPKQSARP